jgi:hypothetical protein
MNGAIRDVLVTGYEPLIEGLKLPDPDDRHILATAIKSGAQVIVTRNLKDFPGADLGPWNVDAKSPTHSSWTRWDQRARHRSIRAAASVQQIADSRINALEAVEDVLAQLERGGLVESAAALRSIQPGATHPASPPLRTGLGSNSHTSTGFAIRTKVN